ncbi:MAG: phosphoribosylformylglycinamidine synthase subunit PurS [Solitalea-like symbiont of Acarus siro]
MNFIANINIMLLEQVLDVQGQSVQNILQKLDIHSVSNVRIGKHIVMHVIANTKSEATEQVKEACEKLLHNPVMETYSFTIENEE